MRIRLDIKISFICLSILLLNVFFSPLVFAEGWKTTSFKIIQESPPVKFSSDFFEDSAQALVYDVNELINPISDQDINKLETYLEKVAKKYKNSYGFKAPVLEVSDSNSYIVYLFDYHDYYTKDGKKIKNPRARYSTGCYGGYQGLYVDRSKLMNGNNIKPIIYETLAHELFHAIQTNYKLFKQHCDLGDWIAEGTAEVMGIEMAEQIQGIKNIHWFGGGLGTITRL